MNTNNLVSIDSVISEIVFDIKDEEFVEFPKGWYISRINDCLVDLSIDTLFFKETIDIYNWNEDGSCQFELDPKIINIREIYLFNKTCAEQECTDSCGCKNSFIQVAWKRLRNNTNKFNTAKILKENMSALNERRHLRTTFSGIVDAGIQNGKLMFSSNAENYNSLRIVYNGIPYDKGDCPTIPIQFKKYIVGFVAEKALKSIKQTDKSRRTDWQDQYNITYSGTRTTLSLQEEAIRRAKALHTFQKDAIKEYIGNYQH